AADTLTREIHQPERHLGRIVALLGGLLIPARSSRKVDFDAMTIGVKDAETELGRGAALLGGELVPASGFLIVAFAADAARIDQPSIGLRIGNSFLGCCPAP